MLSQKPQVKARVKWMPCITDQPRQQSVRTWACKYVRAHVRMYVRSAYVERT